ncbi:hypothetical protein N7495_009257 [Penicillium taxi]|uniref:uncharacterized protein n=1 Tax=Penicillium taxi TaxID=168475 RepID=UPI002544FBCE|nr:uncharacterized protein N7495_009257 [Penicillium taxi]KAJ5884747.1 hypothetical protein N7495_009257 [Penicillium taxi]
MAETHTPPSEQTPLLETATVQEHESSALSVPRGLLIFISMAFLIFIQTSNLSLMTTSQSYISADLDAYTEAIWFTSAHMIAMSSMTPLAGRLSEIFTPRKYVVFTSSVMALGLFITGSAPTLAIFLLGRVVSGCGSGGLMTTAIILALQLSSSKRRGLCIGMISACYTTGLSLGAVLAGLIVPTFGWRLIFWVQAPTALVIGPILFFAIPAPPHDKHPLKKKSLGHSLTRVDYAGALTLIKTLFVVLLLSSFASPTILIWPIPLSFASLGLFILIESRWAREPILPIKVLSTRSVFLTCIAGLGLMMSRWAILFFAPVYALSVRLWSPAMAGLILIPTNLGFGLGGLLVGWIHIRKATSYYVSCLVIYTLFTLSTLSLSVLSTPYSSTFIYVAGLFFNGLFAGSLMNYSLSHILHLTNIHTHFIVTSLVAMSRGFAGSFGSAAGGGFFTRILKSRLESGFAHYGLARPDLVRTLLGSPATVVKLDGLERLVAVESYEHAVRMLFLAGSGIAMLSTIITAGVGWTPEPDTDDKLQEALVEQDE